MLRGLFSFVLCFVIAGSVYADSTSRRLKRKAAAYVVQESNGHFDEEQIEQFADNARVLTDFQVSQRYSSVDRVAGARYIEIGLEDCVADVAIVRVENDGDMYAEYLDWDQEGDARF